MNIALWIIQGLLGFAFLAAGAMKLAKSRESLLANPQMGWTADFSSAQIKLIGFAEVLGALGLVLPRALDIMPVLTPVAAVGLFVIMIGAVVTHIKRKEPAAPAFVLGALSLLSSVGYFCLS